MESTMLVVDDTEINREILRLLFHNSYSIIDAVNGREAMEVLEACQGNVDIVLLDLMMPDMNGFDFLAKMHEKKYLKDIPVVVITSSGAIDDQIKAFELGANDYVNKPFVPEIVVSRVNNVISSHRRMISIELEAEKLKVKSELDQMTGLCNKTTAEDSISSILSAGNNELNALIVIDIDNFKSVNDISGHLAGDHTIRIVADLISSLFRKTDIVGRIGGDEFIVLMCDVTDMEVVRSKINELVQIMKYKPNLTIPENVSLSIGFTDNNRQVVSYAEMFEKADEALFIAKKNGKARAQEYGVEPVVNNENNNGPAVVLVSRNRSVCSAVHGLVPASITILEALQLEDLNQFEDVDSHRIMAIYADVSDIDDASEYWKKLEQYKVVEMDKVISICQEGCLNQFKLALAAGVADILTAPIESTSFKRRIQSIIEKYDGYEE